MDRTQDALRREGYGVDITGFNKEMERQRAEARAAWAGSGEEATEQVWFEIHEKFGSTEFLGYDVELAEGNVLALVVKGEVVDQANNEEEVAIVLNQTPFYGESGGQEGDRGTILTGDTMITVSDTQRRLGGLHVHIGTVSGSSLKTGDDVSLRIDSERRQSLRAHHSATHLLHSALRHSLGEHVVQKGSLVAEDRLRFDFNHPKPISEVELSNIEHAVNREIRANSIVTTRLMMPEEAIEAGALALFGEKYGDEVRVVSMGDSGKQSYSTELCGGTHVSRTGDLGYFKVLSEGAVAAGVRRVEAVNGVAAEAQLGSTQEILDDTAALLKVPPAEVTGRLEILLKERRKLENELAALRRTLATGGGSSKDTGPVVKTVAGIKFAGRALESVPPKELKSLADDLKDQIGSGVVALITTNEGKASLVVGVTDDLTGNINAVDLVRVGSEAVGGKGGGGRPDMAQAGGPDGSRVDNALTAIENALFQRN